MNDKEGMKKNRWLITLTIAFLLAFSVSETSHARAGGGRSSGSRGSRGFAPRPSSPGSSNYGARSAQPQQPTQNPYSANPQMPPSRSSGFLSGLAGGVAGGFLGSMLFRGMGGSQMGGMGGGGGGGFGFLELIILAGLGYFAYRMFMKRNNPTQDFQAPVDVQQGPSLGSTGFSSSPVQNIQSVESPLDVMQAEEPGFDLDRFKDERMDEFLKIQVCWGQRDLTPVSQLLELEIKKTFDEDLSHLRTQGRINKIENVAIRSTDLVEAWVEAGYLYATLHFRANLLDYTIDENTKMLVAGDTANPVKFDEEWTFVRPLSNPRAWKLTAIESV